MSQNNQPKVLVTSGLSHLGSHIILQLLQKGYQVRGIVCDLSNTRCNGLKQLTANASQDLELISINQLDQTSWSE